jgi:hypothetical protein
MLNGFDSSSTNGEPKEAVKCRQHRKQGRGIMILHGPAGANQNDENPVKILPIRPRRTQSNYEVPLVCSSTTEY